MTRHFDDQIQDLEQKLVVMGRLAESMVEAALRTLIERDERLCQEVHRKEREVNELQIEIDDRAVKLTALQQPVATDVRFLFMASRIATELERIGDQAVNICQNAHHVLNAPPMKPIIDLPMMGDIAQKMVRDSLESLVRRDCELANHVLEEENKVDALRDLIFRVLLTYMMADPGTIQRALALILISRNLERVGDHATNVAEEVIYLVEGREVRHLHEINTRSGS
ncbi:MAG: phosphate transport system regulatory protein PhoU [Acidobacteria bacterium]|nr:MAG: phosphate transport system regulatory protein PhoU [Acidobacteriota bacterium]